MQKAIFIKENVKKLITPNEIESRKDYIRNYRGYLYCAEPGCSAKLVFAEIPSRFNPKIFKTAIGSNHSDTCPHRIFRKLSKGPRVTSATVHQALSDEHIKSILKGLSDRNIPGFKKNPSPSKRKKSNSTNPKGAPSDTMNVVPTLEPDGNIVKKGREPVVKKRNCNAVLPEDYSLLRGIDGYVNKAIINENFIEFLYRTESSEPVSLLFYNAFRDKSEQAYNIIKNLASKINAEDYEPLVCCVGVIEKKEDKVQIQIMDPSYIKFENNQSVFNYTS